MRQLFLIAARSLLQHRLRTSLLGAAVAFVTALLIILTGISVGTRHTMVKAATTLMTGHVNVAGFYKFTAGQSAPVVTGYKKLTELVKREVPELDFVVHRGRGWAKLIGDTGSSMMLGVGGIDVAHESGFKRVIIVQSGRLDDLAQPNTVLLFEEQAKKLEVKVGDTLTMAAPTFRGTNNTVDVRVVAIAANVGLLSSFNCFVPEESLRKLYQLNDDTTGALHIYLRDIQLSSAVQARLREVLGKEGYRLMDADARPFWQKFQSVNREAWTGQKLDITSWEDEITFIKWTVDLLAALSVTVTSILIVIICVGMMNVMWISIRERTREIGTLRAIGMQRRTVLGMFLTEGFVLGLGGTALGAALGLAVSGGLNVAQVPLPLGVQMFLMTEHLVLTPTPGWVLFAIAFVTGSITAISVVPSFLAARLKPITAMHHIG